MKETYKVKLPKHIVIGDPNYFKEFTGSELERLTVDYDVSKNFTDARVTIESSPCEDMPELTLLDMTIYLAPKSTMHTYLEGMIYKSQNHTEKDIGVDTAKYLLEVDGKSDTIYTAADGCWGSFQEIFREMSGKKMVDAVIINLGFPDDFEDIDRLRERVNYFFEDVEQVPNAFEDEDETMNIGGIQQ